jgi:LmbE family N-acetylglucosaminyl deacetylase
MLFRQQLRQLKRGANFALERLCSLGFAAFGRIRRSQPARWSSTGGRSVLVVAPHPDDEAIGCVGTILLHILAGDAVRIAIATDGRRSTALPDPQQMALQRQHEARAAANLMGVEQLAWLGLPEGDCSAAALQHSLQALLRDLQPDLIYAPSRIDFHPEHWKVAHALALALAAEVTAPTLRIYQIQVPLTARICNLVADVSSVAEHSRSVLGAYTSQQGTIQGTLRLRRYGAILHGFRAHAEEFWELTSRRYIELHHTTPREWPAVFRGLRSFSLSDPLAYLAGRAERRRLRAVTDSAETQSPLLPPKHLSL